MTRSYNRSEIISYYELSEAQKQSVIGNYDNEDLVGEDSFILFEIEGKESEALPLSMFMRIDKNKIWHGIYSLSAFSAYFIHIAKSGDGVIVAYKYF